MSEYKVTTPIPPSREAFQEAFNLASELLKDIELFRLPLETISLKASRLAQILNDSDHQQIFQYEASGYPANPNGVPPEIWRLVQLAGRTYYWQDPATKDIKSVAFLESIEQIENQIEGAKLALQAAVDRTVSLSSANPNQYLFSPTGNYHERQGYLGQINTASNHLSSRRILLHSYVSSRYFELKYSSYSQDVFSVVRQAVDSSIADLIPDAVQKFVSIHDNLRSENPEDWSNAVHSCRRLLQDLANAVFPPQNQPRILSTDKEIALGVENYINRLVCYAEDHSKSERFNELVGSHLEYLGNRLDAIFKAAQKGSHNVVTREEANRYVVYTYMLIGDLLSLQ